VTNLLQNLVDILSGASLYALITLGLALLVGLMGLMNFAYGELIMAGGFALYLTAGSGWPVVVVVTVGVVVAISLLTERIAFRPLRGASPLTLLVASFTVSVMLQNLARMTVGPQTKGVAPWEFIQRNVEIGGVEIARLDLATILLAVVLLLGLLVVLRRTTLGVQLRAAAEDFEMAEIVGVRSNRVIAAGFALTGIIAAAVTFVIVTQQGSVTPTMGQGPVLIAFVGVVIGGMGSLLGATLGGLLLGAATSALDVWLPGDLSPFRDAFVFALVIGVLVLRPQGLLPGRKARIA
jgi:branched-chain amino acid transport system permease protein